MDSAGTGIRLGARSLEHWILLASALAAALLLLLLALFTTPDPRGYGTHAQLFLPSCLTIEWWGVPCPGCGVTTSISLAAHGRFVESFHNQPFGFLVALILAALAPAALALHLAGRDLHQVAGRVRWPLLLVPLALALLAGWIWKLGLVERWWH